MIHQSNFFALLAFATQVGLGTATLAHAAETASGNTTPEIAYANGDTVKLDKYEVTGSRQGDYVSKESTFATRTDTPLRDTPASIQIITSQLIADKGALSPDTVMSNVSGVSRGSMNDGNYGVGNNYYARGLDVKLLRDGFSEGVGRYANYARSLVGVERIEVLKGPGSALYGNSYGGAVIDFISAEPQAHAAYELKAFAGSFGTTGATLSATGPLADNAFTYRLDAGIRDSDGFRGVLDRSREILAAVRAQISPVQSLTVRAEYREIERQTDTVGVPYKNGLGLIPLPRDAKLYTKHALSENDAFSTRANWLYTPATDTTLRAQVAYTTRDITVARNRAGVNQPTYNVTTGLFPAAGDASYYNLTGRTFDDQHDNLDTLTASLEAVKKITTGPVRHTFLAGTEFFRATDDTRDNRAILGPIADVRLVSTGSLPGDDESSVLYTPLFQNRQLRLNTLAAYFQDQLEFSEQWKARVALRVDRFALVDAGDYNIAAPLTTTTLAADGQSFIPATPIFRHERGENVTAKGTVQGGLVYQPTKFTSFYVGAATGAKAQFDTESARSANVPEASRSYELGNKTSLLGDRLNFNVALFETSRRNFSATLPDGSVATVGEIRTRGVEADLTAAPVVGWNILVSAALQDPEYRVFATTDAYTGVRFDAKGYQTTGVPKRLASLWSTYTFQTGKLKGFGFGAGLEGKSSIYIDVSNKQRVPGYGVASAALFYRTARWSAQVNIQNVTDRVYYARLANTTAFPGDPRSLLFTVTAKF